MVNEQREWHGQNKCLGLTPGALQSQGLARQGPGSGQSLWWQMLSAYHKWWRDAKTATFSWWNPVLFWPQSPLVRADSGRVCLVTSLSVWMQSVWIQPNVCSLLGKCLTKWKMESFCKKELLPSGVVSRELTCLFPSHLMSLPFPSDLTQSWH